MADLSIIPITRADLKLVKGEHRILHIRLAQRLGFGKRLDNIRKLIVEHEAKVEQRYGPLLRTEAKSSGGRPLTNIWLLPQQAVFYATRSGADNADEVVLELIDAFFNRDAATPTIDALLAPDAPTVRKGDGNVVHIEHEEWTQPELFAPPTPSVGEAHLNAIAGPPSKPRGFNEVEWRESEAGVEYSVIKSLRRNGAPMSLFFSRPGISHVATEAVFWVPDPSGNGDQVGLYLNHVIPLAVVERAVDRLGIGPMSTLTHNTLRHYLAF